MAKLIYATITSLDGYVADENGDFAWGEPNEEMHKFVNNLEQTIGTYLYGRRMYEVMVVWETMHALPDQPGYILEYSEIWRDTDKIVYSKTLEGASSSRTRIEREFDPEAIRQMKMQAERDISVAGPELAAQALAAGLVDEIHRFVSPVVVGGGNQSLPDDLRLNLELLDENRFTGGMVHLRYAIRH